MSLPPLASETEQISICVFCGAQNAVDQQHLSVGKEVGEIIAKDGYRLVFGGGDCGMMGAVANAAMAANGPVIGVFPHHLKQMEVEHKGLTQTIIVNNMHERKKLMYDLSDAFFILPGGFGTMDEMFEILTWRQLGLHEKPIIIFNHLGYWTPLIKMMEHIIANKFAGEVNRSFFEVVETVDDLFKRLKATPIKKVAEPAPNTVDNLI